MTSGCKHVPVYSYAKCCWICVACGLKTWSFLGMVPWPSFEKDEAAPVKAEEQA